MDILGLSYLDFAPEPVLILVLELEWLDGFGFCCTP